MMDEPNKDDAALVAGDSEAEVADVIEVSDVKARKRFGVGALLGAMFLSSVCGAGIIGLVSHFNSGADVDLTPLETKIETVSGEAQSLAAQNKTLKAQIAKLQRDIKSRPAAVSIDLSPLESRVQSLEKAEPKEIDAELLTRLEALQNEGSEALDLSDILKRLERLESRPVAVAVAPVKITPSETDIVFPMAKVMAALDAGETSRGWLKKSLNKHISVQSEDNPRYLVELIETHIAAGDMSAAIATFDKLPPKAKAAAQDWRESLSQ